MPTVRDNVIAELKRLGQPVTDENIQQVYEQYVRHTLGDDGPRDDQGNVLTNYKPVSGFFLDNEGRVTRKYKNTETGEEDWAWFPVPMPELKTFGGEPLLSMPKPAETELTKPKEEPAAPTEPIDKFKEPPQPIAEAAPETPVDETLEKFAPTPQQKAEQEALGYTSGGDKIIETTPEGDPVVKRDGKKVLEKIVGDEVKPGTAEYNTQDAGSISDTEGMTTQPDATERRKFARFEDPKDTRNPPPQVIDDARDVTLKDINIKGSKETGSQSTAVKQPTEKVMEVADKAIEIIQKILDKVGKDKKEIKPRDVERKQVLDQFKKDMTAADKVRFWDNVIGGLGDIAAGATGMWGFKRPVAVPKFFKYQPQDVKQLTGAAESKAKIGLKNIKEMEDLAIEARKQGLDKETLDALDRTTRFLQTMMSGTGSVVNTKVSGERELVGGASLYEMLKKFEELRKLQAIKEKGKTDRAGIYGDIANKRSKEETDTTESDVPESLKAIIRAITSDSPKVKQLSKELVNPDLTDAERKEMFVSVYAGSGAVDVGTAVQMYEDYVKDGGIDRLKKDPYDLQRTFNLSSLMEIANNAITKKKSTDKEGKSETITQKKVPMPMPEVRGGDKPVQLPNKSAPAPKEVPAILTGNRLKKVPPPPPVKATPKPSPVEETKKARAAAGVGEKVGWYVSDEFPQKQTVVKEPNGTVTLYPSLKVLSGKEALEVLSKVTK